MVTAVKFTISDQPQPIDPLLKNCIGNKRSHRFLIPSDPSLILHVTTQRSEVDLSLFLFPGDFLKTLADPDLNVRRVALVTFNSAAHNKPSLIRELLDSVLPQLYNETKVRKELIREVSVHTRCVLSSPGTPTEALLRECVCLFTGGDGPVQTHG